MKKLIIAILLAAIILGVTVLLLLMFPKKSNLPETAGMGPSPTLPAPDPSLVPILKVAKAVGWSEGDKPIAAPGLAVSAFAKNLDHPRWLYVLPNGDVLVAEANAPPQPTIKSGLIAKAKGMAMQLAMKRAGAAVPSANRITLLRDSNGDGVADVQTVFLDNLYSPFGMALVDNTLYVANANALVRFPYTPGETSISAPSVQVTDLTAGTRNHHWTKDLIASANGSKLYVSVGSNSNIAENGFDEEVGRAAIWQIDRATGKSRIFASGLRNPNGMSWQPQTGELWIVVNERDDIGNDLVPDYLTLVKDGGFYGWPYSYYGQHVDKRVQPQNAELVAKAITPSYALGSHVAALGLTFYTGNLLPRQYHNGAFIGEHGSWNRNPRVGYKVIFVPFANGKPAGMPKDILTGFLNDKGQAQGRPVGVVVDKTGALLVADDVGNTIWRITPDPV